MASDTKHVMVIGASGTLGSVVLKHLISDTNYSVTVLARPQSTAAFPPNVRVVRAEQTPALLVSAFRGQHAVISTSSITSLPDQKKFINAAVTAGVRQFVLNDFANFQNFNGLPELEIYRTPKFEIQQHAKTHADKNPNFAWTSLATAHFIDYAIKKFPAFGFNIADRTARLVDDGEETFSATTVDDIAIAVVGIIKHPEATANKFLYVRSVETTQKAILAAFERQTNEKWTVNHVTSKDLLETARAKMALGQNAMLELVPAQLYERGAGRQAVAQDFLDNDLLGVQEKSVEEVVRSILSGC